MIQVALTDAKARLTELVRKAEAGEDVILTRHGRPAARIVPADDRPLSEIRREAWDRARAAVRAMNLPPGPDAARAADFLYDEDGLLG